ncbi:MAG TPA: hypothetical protein VNK82_11015 [Terriglobales bacterium]|nr:hypothetical protein [Terriglobales bacterium]
MMSTQAESRRLHRYQLNLPIKVRWSSGEQSGTAAGMIRDINEKGVYFLTGSEVPAEAFIEFILERPAELSTDSVRRLLFSGKVVRVEASGNQTGVAAQLEQCQQLSDSQAEEAAAKIAGDWREQIEAYMKDQQEKEKEIKKQYNSRANLASQIGAVVLGVALALILASWYFKKEPDLLQRQLTAGNPNAQVWVHMKSGLYYCKDDRDYGNLHPGRYTNQREAQLNYNRPATGRPCP